MIRAMDLLKIQYADSANNVSDLLFLYKVSRIIFSFRIKEIKTYSDWGSLNWARSIRQISFGGRAYRKSYSLIIMSFDTKIRWWHVLFLWKSELGEYECNGERSQRASSKKVDIIILFSIFPSHLSLNSNTLQPHLLPSVPHPLLSMPFPISDINIYAQLSICKVSGNVMYQSNLFDKMIFCEWLEGWTYFKCERGHRTRTWA